MNNKTCIITGGNRGIGKAIALTLAHRRANVVIVSRNFRNGANAQAEIRAETKNENVDLVIGDLGTINGTRQLAADLLERYTKIHVLINNAGVWMTRRVINEDGLEISFMVNHLGPFVLSNLLLERLKEGAPARIINVNAGLYLKGKVDLEKTPYGHDFSKFRTYASTKLCNMLFTCEFARRIEGSGVTVNAVHPGVIRTNLGDTSGFSGLLLGIMKRFWDPPEVGARAPVWLATAPELQGVNGKYFDQQRETKLTEAAQDRHLASELWELSTQLAGLWSG